MYSSVCCVWAVMMTLTVAFCLFPQFALCHLGSAVRAGADGKHPMLSHTRVSREPQARVAYREDFDFGPAPPLQTSRIKSPSYQHKVLQFHGQTSSGQDYYPSKLIVNEYPSVKALPVYPVPSKYGKLGGIYIVKSTSTKDNNNNEGSEDSYNGNDSLESEGRRWEPNLLPLPEDPTFTPHIGARALTNIPRFFEHLRENLQALYDQRQAAAAGKGEVTGSSSERDGDQDIDKYLGAEDDIEKIATPTRRGYPSISEPTVAQTLSRHVVDLEGGNRGDLTNRDSRSASRSFILANRFLNRKSGEDGEANDDDTEAPDEKTKELLDFLGHGKPEYPRANNYNPGWLFTNLGLGKRSHSSAGLNR